MKKLILIFFLFGASNLFAQQQEDSLLVKEIPTIQNDLSRQQQEIDVLNKMLDVQKNMIEATSAEQQQKIDSLSLCLEVLTKKIGMQNKTLKSLQTESENLNASMDSLNQLIQTNSQNIVSNSQELGAKIQETGQKADSQIAVLDSNVEKNRLYWIIATLATFLLGALIYWLLGKQISSSKTDVETQIRKTKATMEEEGVKLDGKLVELLETQLKLQQESIKAQPNASREQADHSLALKVADEIIRIQKNLNQMDESVKGLKQLKSSVQRIQDNFASNGYELVEMLGKEYHEGMKANVNFVQNEDFEPGKKIITRIIKPQVNYNGTMIQVAQIEVTEA
ncbi:MAG: hypothetical protein ACK5LR_01810 [Mangrovibacterium sp.]